MVVCARARHVAPPSVRVTGRPKNWRFHDPRLMLGDTAELSGNDAVRLMRRVISRYVAVLWLLAALSLIGWLVVNLDTAGWILVILTSGLMAWELTTRKSSKGGDSRGRRPDEPTP